MRLGKDLTGKPIVSITDGRMLGNVKDIYVDHELNQVIGVFLGHEGLIKRKSHLIQRDNIVVLGIDTILVKNANVVTDDEQLPEAQEWLRLSKLRGRQIDTPGGTKVGTVGDIEVGEAGQITAFPLARVFVEGPVAELGTVPRHALIDTGSEDRAITIDLPKVERQEEEEKEEVQKPDISPEE